MDQPKRQLKIDLDDLESAFEHHGDLEEIAYYLDLGTGEVVLVTGEDRRELDDVYRQYGDPETGEVNLQAVLPDLDIPDWQKDSLLEADRVESGYDTRFIAIPQVESHEGYNDMVAFIETVANPLLQERLERAIHGRGAFRYFKDVLLDYPKERERWFQFSNERMRQRVLEWLDSEGIEPI